MTLARSWGNDDDEMEEEDGVLFWGPFQATEPLWERLLIPMKPLCSEMTHPPHSSEMVLISVWSDSVCTHSLVWLPILLSIIFSQMVKTPHGILDQCYPREILFMPHY